MKHKQPVIPSEAEGPVYSVSAEGGFHILTPVFKNSKLSPSILSVIGGCHFSLIGEICVILSSPRRRGLWTLKNAKQSHFKPNNNSAAAQAARLH